MRIRWFSMLALFWGVAHAQGTFMPHTPEREGRWDISLVLNSHSSLNVQGQQGTFIHFRSTNGWGFGVDYNFNNRFSLGGEFLFAEPHYTGRFIDENNMPYDISHRASFFTGQLRGTWNILPGALTPYVDGSLGWTNVDSNVSSGPPVTGCWWDPWWGYICRDFYNTYSDTNFTYSLGGGVRWDVNSQFGVRAGFRRQVIDLGSGTDDPEFDSLGLSFIFRQ